MASALWRTRCSMITRRRASPAWRCTRWRWPRRARGDRPCFVQGDLLRLPFAAASADLLLALDSFDQAGVDLGAALAEARRVLRPGGLLLLRVSAHPRLQGAHDVAFNTGRRYTFAEVHYALELENYGLERKSYANLLLAAPVVALRTLSGRRSTQQQQPHRPASFPFWRGKAAGGALLSLSRVESEQEGYVAAGAPHARDTTRTPPVASSIYASRAANAVIHVALAAESVWLRRANLPGRAKPARSGKEDGLKIEA